MENMERAEFRPEGHVDRGRLRMTRIGSAAGFCNRSAMRVADAVRGIARSTLYSAAGLSGPSSEWRGAMRGWQVRSPAGVMRKVTAPSTWVERTWQVSP